MKKIELLAPAGDFKCLIAAINNGADAVYLGGSNFSARAFATNFDNEQIVEVIKYAHLRNVKIYVTINTLLNENEIENAYKQAKFLYENNVDALIIQDLGLLYRLRQDFKDFELHASTQMHIHNLAGVKNAAKLGIKRVVVARESSLDLIQKMCQEDIEIECFIHGAICVSYSGQCLLSSYTKNRSANKGMCAQCCRLKYKLKDTNGKQIKTDTDYLLSPKDMCLIEDIPSLIEAGVSSLKIEGRMKSAAYVGYITRLYREAIDAYYQNKVFKFTDEMKTNMRILFNRGFTDTYLKNDNQELFSNIRPNHIGIEIGKVVKVNKNQAFIKLNNDINQFDGIRIINQKNDTGLILNMLKVNNKLVSKAYKNEIVEVILDDTVDVNDIVLKTLDYQLEDSILKTEDKKIPIELKIKAKVNNHLQIECSTFNYQYQSSELIEEAIKSPLNNDNFIECFKKTDLHPYEINDIKLDIDEVFIPMKVLNNIRRDFYEKLDLNRLTSFKREMIKELKLPKLINYQLNTNLDETNSDYYFNHIVNLDDDYKDNKNVVSEFGGLYLAGDKIAYYSLNITNSYTLEFINRLGFKAGILSTELNTQMIIELIDAYKKRNGFINKPYIMKKGSVALMNIARNPFKKYLNSDSRYFINDGNNEFSIINNGKYIEIKSDIIENEIVDDTLMFIKE